MPLNPNNTESNAEVHEAGIVQESNVEDAYEAGTIDSGAVIQSQSPKSLVDLILDLVAQDPLTSRQLVQSNSFENSHIIEVLSKNSPFIELVPADVKCYLIATLSYKDWQSLYHVNKEWRNVVVAAAKIFLNEVAQDKPTIIQADKIDDILKNLMKLVGEYNCNPGGSGRAEQVQKIKQLKKEMNNLESPLAKLIYFKKRLNEVQSEIENEYGNRYSMRLFGPRNSRLFQIVNFTKEACQQLMESPWFKKVQFCVDICPEHSISTYYSKTYLEPNSQKKSVEKQTKDISQLEEQFDSLSRLFSM